MSLLDDVSIVVTPNGYKAGELYAVIPSSGAADMDVTRATDATRVDENGKIQNILANIPRIDYTGGGCPHILAEPQRTNLLSYSENLSQWDTRASPVVTYNATASPDGNVTATELMSTSVSSRLQQDVGVLSEGEYTQSLFVKYKNADAKVNFKNNSFGGSNTFNITSSGVTVDSASSPTAIVEIGGGWFKISITYTTNGTNNSIVQVFGDFNVLASYYLWGVQLEEGSNATSYIPTSGSTVTINKDQFQNENIGSLINNTEGVLFLEMAALSNDGTKRTISISDGTLDNRVIVRYTETSGEIQALVVSGGTTQYTETKSSLTVTEYTKIAVKYKENEFSMWINGLRIGTDSSGLIPIGMDAIKFDSGVGTNTLFGKVKQLQIYNKDLTDAQLEALTS